MRKRYPGYFFILIILTLLASGSDSCTPETCLEETLSGVKAVLFNTDAGKVQAPDSITLYGIGPSTEKIYDRSANRQTISIPLDAGRNTCSFVIKINDKTDTLVFTYTSYPHLVSKECGFTFFHSLTEAGNKNEDIDINIVNRAISTSNEENIRIFY